MTHPSLERVGAGRRATLATLATLALCLLALWGVACAEMRPEPSPDWPLACSPFASQAEVVAECARRTPDGEVVIRPGALPALDGATTPRGVLVEDTLFFALESGKTAPALLYDNGPDYFVEGLARSPRGGKIGFVDERLDLVVPREWDFAFPFEDGVARVCTECVERCADGDEHCEIVGGSWGHVDREGREVSPQVVGTANSGN